MSRKQTTKKLDVKKQTLRTLGGADLARAAGGADFDVQYINSRGRGTVSAGAK